MEYDQLTKHDRLSSHILKRNIRKFQKYTVYTFLGLFIVVTFQFSANTVHSMADKILVTGNGCEYQEYYANYEQGSWERENAYANQMLGIYKCE